MTPLDHSWPKARVPIGMARGVLGTGAETASGRFEAGGKRFAGAPETRNAARGDDHPLRIMLVTEPGVNGVFRHVEALAHFLLARGHRVDLGYSDVRGSDRLTDLVTTIAAAGGRTLNLSTGNVPGPRDVSALLRLRRFVSAARPDAIHAHSSKAGALVRLLPLLGVREPLFYTPHAYYGMGAPAGRKTKFFGLIERALGKVGTTFTLSGCELAHAEKTLHVARKRLRLVPNPVDTHHFTPPTPEAKRRLRGELGLPDDALLLGCVGRFSFQKDPLTLCRSLAVALGRVKNLWLYHLGTGELVDDCNRLAVELGVKDRIIRRDYLSDPLPFYHTIDAAILTSRYEGLSFAVLEALGCDLPIILSEAPGNLDFLKMGLSHCWPAAVANPELTAQAIARWAADRSSQRPSNHRATAEGRFSQEICFGAVVEEYLGQVRR